MSASRFAAFRAVKHHPRSEVFSELFKAMRAACGYEKQVASLHGFACRAVEKEANAAGDDIQLIARVRRLRVNEFAVGSARNVNLNLQRAVFKQRDEARVFRFSQSLQGDGHGEMRALRAKWFCHCV